MIYFSISFVFILIIAGYIVSKSKKFLCTLCEKEVSNVTKVNDQIFLCDNHVNLFKKSDLKPFLSVLCTPNDFESGIFLYELFKQLLSQEVYCHIMTEYEVVSDHIETKQTLFVDYNNIDKIISYTS